MKLKNILIVILSGIVMIFILLLIGNLSKHLPIESSGVNRIKGNPMSLPEGKDYKDWKKPIVYATSTLSNFIFAYPENAYVSGFGWEKVPTKGNISIRIPSSSETNVYIFTNSSPISSFNPKATTLRDYKTDYFTTGIAGDRQVLVHNKLVTLSIREEVLVSTSTEVVVNGIPMLRQRYSLGFWSLDAQGEKYFDTSNETSLKNLLRYVFFDGKTFVIITGFGSESYIDQIAQSLYLLK